MKQTTINTILRIDSSASQQHSTTRKIGDELIKRLLLENPQAQVITRNLADGIDFIEQDWVNANLTDPEQRTLEQQDVLKKSDELVAELAAADTVVLTTPLYNFSIPATLKAWIDMVCRARLSFHYTSNGPVGLLSNRPVYVAMASGGVSFGSHMDFASGYLKHIFKFIGIDDLRMIYAERTNADIAASEANALNSMNEWLPITS